MKCFDFLSEIVGQGVINVLSAVLLAILAFFVATMAEDLSHHFFVRWKDKLGEGVTAIGELVYLVVLLLFAPGIFERLGAGSVTAPIFQTMQKLFAFLPDIIGAGLVLAIGSSIAKMLRSLVKPVLEKAKADTWLEKAGFHPEFKLSETLAYTVYVLVMIPVAIASLEILHIRSLTQPAVAVLNKCLNFVPNLFAAIVLAGIGVLVSGIAYKFVMQIVSASGVDAKVSGWTGKDEKVSKLVASIIYAFILLSFVVESINVLHLPVLSRIGTSVISYIPNLLAVTFIFALASFATSVLQKSFGDSCWSHCVRIFIYCISVFMAFSQLQIGIHIVEPLFHLLLFGIVFALAVAFGFGGRQPVSEYLSYWVKKKMAEDVSEEGKADNK